MRLNTTEESSTHWCLPVAVAAILVAVLVAGAALHIFGLDVLCLLPNRTLCPFRTLTGLACPGCGMTRAFLALGQLRITKALAENPFSIALVVLMGSYVLSSGRRCVKFVRKYRLDWIGVVSVLVFWGHRISQQLSRGDF